MRFWFRVDWNTLIDPTIPIVAWALDNDANQMTGIDNWPAGAGVSSSGVDSTVVVSGQGAWLYDSDGGRVSVDDLGGRHWTDTTARSFIVRVPANLFPSTDKAQIRLASGLATADGESFAPLPPDLGAAPGQPAVYNMAFRSHDQESGYWMDNRQAQVLMEGDVSEFALDVSWQDLVEKRATEEPLPTGFTNRWYVSSVEVAEFDESGQGLRTDANGPDQRPNFFGRVQPYSIYVPRSYDAGNPAPLTFMLHALNLNHNQFGVNNPRFMELACERRGAICVGPEGRGPDGYTADEAELDFFEIWNRVATSYAVDPERTSLVGYSMGGFGVYRQGLLYPHLFSRAVVLAGPPTCGIRVVPGVEVKPEPTFNGKCVTDGNITGLLESARWLPFYLGVAGADELVPVTGVLFHERRFEELGYRYRMDLYPAQDHATWFLQDAFDEAATQLDGGRKVNPGRISYTWYPNLINAELDLGPTGAYWLKQATGRKVGPGSVARMEATSEARPEAAVVLERTVGPVIPGQDSPGAYKGTSGVRKEQRWLSGDASGRAPRVSMELTNVSAVLADLAGAGLLPSESSTVVVTTDGDTRLDLVGLGAFASVVLDEVIVSRGDRDGRVTLMLTAGTHQINLSPRR